MIKMDIGKRLTRLLNKNKLLFDECVNGSGELIKTLLECVDNNYRFDVKQLNSFIKQATSGNAKFLETNTNDNKRIIKYIFTNHDIPPKGFELLATTWYIYYYKLNYWLECMFEKKHIFSINELCALMGYKILDCGDYDTVNNNVVYGVCLGMVRNYKIMAEKYLKIIADNKEPFNPEHLELVIRILEKNYGDQVANCVWFGQLLDNLLSGCKENNVFNVLMKKYNLNGVIIKVYEYVIDHFGYSDEFVNFIFENIIKYYPPIIFNLIDKGYKLTMDNINDLLKVSLSFSIIPTKYEFTKTFPITHTNKTQIDTHELYKMFDLTPSLNELHIACNKNAMKVALYLMDEFNIIPEKETLDICVSKLNYELVEKVLHYKLSPDEDTLNKIKGNYSGSCPKMIDLLLAHGLVINSSHMEFLMTNRIAVNDLERFDIKYDDKLYFLCYLYDFFPDQYIAKIPVDNNLEKLYKLCKSKRLHIDKLKDFMKTNKIGLNKYAFEYLIIQNGDVATDLMKTFKIEPPIITMYKRCYTPLETIMDVVKKNGIDEMYMLKCYDICL